MKKEKPKTPQAQPLDFPFEDENKIVDFITKHGRKFLYLVFALLLLSVLIYRMGAASRIKAEKDYLTAENAFAKFQKNLNENEHPSSNVSLNKLVTILKQHPELHQKYDSLISQTLIKQNEGEEAQSFGTLALDRISKQGIPFYPDFATTSFLIAQGQYETALNQASQLKQRMITENTPSQDLLFAFNLLRIATLQQKLEKKVQELASWKELSQFLEGHQQSSLSSFLKHYQDGQVSFDLYIETRKKMLKE